MTEGENAATPPTPSSPIDNNQVNSSEIDSGQIDIELFAKIKLRVGRIESAEALPKSKKLLKLQVDLGAALGKRQVLAGIAQFYPPDALPGKRVIIVSNLKPAKLMGEMSEGMLLAASNPDGSVLAIVEPAENIELGAEVR